MYPYLLAALVLLAAHGNAMAQTRDPEPAPRRASFKPNLNPEVMPRTKGAGTGSDERGVLASAAKAGPHGIVAGRCKGRIDLGDGELSAALYFATGVCSPSAAYFLPQAAWRLLVDFDSQVVPSARR